MATRGLYLLLKRALDFIVSAVLLVLLSPLMLVIALAVRLTMGSPVLFRQERPGIHAEPFTLLKFRTMRDADCSGIEAVCTDEERTTPLGRFLRTTSLDELPELLNILRGDMSIVGPRPMLMEYVPLFNEHQYRRHEVRPGLTGLAQVSGRNALSWEDRFELDVRYVDSIGFVTDTSILLRTVGVVLSRYGASGTEVAPLEPFRGTGDDRSTR